jgi:hypothetical protein
MALHQKQGKPGEPRFALGHEICQDQMDDNLSAINSAAIAAPV